MNEKAKVEVWLSEKEVVEYAGPRCPEYVEGCACCDAWARFDQNEPMVFDVPASVAKRWMYDY